VRAAHLEVVPSEGERLYGRGARLWPVARVSAREVWLALRVNIRQVLETVTLSDIVAGTLPEPIGTLASHPEAAEQRLTRFGRRRESA
jgi:DNA-binding IscR family transcriptional regulator